MADVDPENKSCSFFFKKGSKFKGARKRRAQSSDDSGDDDVEAETTVIKKERKGIVVNPLKQSTMRAKVKDKVQVERESSDDDDDDKVTHSYKSTKTAKSLGPADMGATATVEIDTELDRDAQAIFERSLQMNKDLKDKEDDKVYRGINNYAHFIEKKDTAQGNAASGGVRKGPIRAPANLRATVRWDYAPDICKDYKETGFCGFGDSCKFMHDRGDYKHGWQLEREMEQGTYDNEDMSKYEISDSDDDLPFKCFICRDTFKDPVITKCKHYFCEKCALAQFKKTRRCFVCGENTMGVFNPAKDLIKKLGKNEEEKRVKQDDSSESDDDDGE